MRADIAAYLEYATYAPVLDVLTEALDLTGWTPESWEIYGEQVGQIASERALDGSSTATSDAERIWRFQRTERALTAYASVAPMHAEACRTVLAGTRI